MAIQLYNSADQADGAFDGGRILEKKPIGFPQDRGKLRPMSSLFYWAHAWSDEGGLIGEHPHQGFEIVSYVIRGEIQHYDSQLRDWKSLHAGDAQIIRAGSGITHAERLMPGSAIFQIWFDPGLDASLRRPASYDDYPVKDFPKEEGNGTRRTIIAGEKGPMRMETKGVVMEEWLLDHEGAFTQSAHGKITGVFLLNGGVTVANTAMVQGDFLLATGETHLPLAAREDSRVFILQIPEKVEYMLYIDRIGR